MTSQDSPWKEDSMQKYKVNFLEKLYVIIHIIHVSLILQAIKYTLLTSHLLINGRYDHE